MITSSAQHSPLVLDALPGTEVLWHVTVLSNFLRGYDKYSRIYSKRGIPESSYPDRFYLLRETDLAAGVRKARGLLDRLAIPGNRLLALQTHVPAAELKDNLRTGIGCYVETSDICLENVAWIEEDLPQCLLLPVSVEEATAAAFRLLQPELRAFPELQPRTFSVLPIARGCQAQCPFCFSEASASAEQAQGRFDLDRVRKLARVAKTRGAERFVITGGGEPGLVPHATLTDFIAAGRETVGKTVLITNGHHLGRQQATARSGALADYHNAGLSVLAVSHHHFDDARNAELMGLAIDAAAVADTWRRGRQRWPNLRLRFTCVLQQGGIDSVAAMEDYVGWACELGVEELCFKELYVSTSVESVYYRHSANEWGRQHQVPLAVVLDFATRHNFEEVSRLPWGSPIFCGTWNGRLMAIAAYTEPSLFWERTHGIARSWNLMADGNCLASLEDRASLIELENVA